MNEVETKKEEQTTEQSKPNFWRRLAEGRRIAIIAAAVVAVLAAVAGLYINGKLDLLRYNDGSVEEMGDIDAARTRTWTAPAWPTPEKEMTMPEAPFL